MMPRKRHRCHQSDRQPAAPPSLLAPHRPRQPHLAALLQAPRCQPARGRRAWQPWQRRGGGGAPQRRMVHLPPSAVGQI
jgi:hypothetical protein